MLNPLDHFFPDVGLPLRVGGAVYQALKPDVLSCLKLDDMNTRSQGHMYGPSPTVQPGHSQGPCHWIAACGIHADKNEDWGWIVPCGRHCVVSPFRGY